eukprot:scaffold55348_cov41-Phaeocystis_antarctica.AAC.1
MAHAFAELRDGVVARQHENGFKCGHNFAQTLYGALYLDAHATHQGGYITCDNQIIKAVRPYYNFTHYLPYSTY